MDKTSLFTRLSAEARAVLAGGGDLLPRLQRLCDLLKAEVSYYDWVGFYLVDPKWRQELFLGPYAGEPTEHIRIMFGKGVCGRAAATRETFVVQDVSKETNYLACSPKVKAEIVIPVFKGNNIWGELDVDSHSVAPFSEEDTAFLEELADAIGELV